MRGPALLLLGIALFGFLDANNKLLSGSYGLGQVVALRYGVILAALAVARVVAGASAVPFVTARPGLHAVRAAAMSISAAGFYIAFRELPLAEGYLVFFTAPFLILALAAAVLRERVSPAGWAWCGVAFAGVVIAVAPRLGTGGSPWALAAALVATLGYAVAQTANRALRDEPGMGRLLLWPSVLGVLVFGPLAAWEWVAPPPLDLAMLLANGGFAGVAVLATAVAFRYADAARLGPWNYAALPVSFVFDAALWNVWPNPTMLAGAAVVVAACVMGERAGQGASARKEPDAAAPAPRAIAQPRDVGI